MLYAAAQAVTPAPTAPATAAPAVVPSSISVGADGRISGIDGMLDQISGALLRQAKTEILPTIMSDREMQATVGKAAGKALAKPLWVMAGIAAVYVGWVIWSANSEPSRRLRSSRTRYTR